MELQLNGQQVFMVTAEELAEYTRNIVRDTMSQMMGVFQQPKKQDDSMTASEAAKYLRISKTYLWQLEKQKKLMPFRIGRRVFYHRADVEAMRQNG
jgi:excisionase family DNA binding protein